MERPLRRQLRDIGHDKHSGANELALRTVAAVESWIVRNRRCGEAGLAEVLRAVRETQPDMAPFMRLANEVALAMDAEQPAAQLLEACCAMRETLESGSRRIFAQFRKALSRGPRKTILTYSYSSTVLRALIAAKSRIARVYCSEASPGMDGHILARKLAAAAIHVVLTTDMGLLDLFPSAQGHLPRPDVVVVGADQVRAGCWVNRYGTDVLLTEARNARVPFWILTDTTKFIPARRGEVFRGKREPASQLWKNAPENVTPSLSLLGTAPLAGHVRVLTELGWMTPKQVRRFIGRIRISPRLRDAAK